MPTLYEVLGIKPDATDAEIKHAYRRLTRKFHPDRNPGDNDCVAKFKDVQNAYEVLSDKQERAKYDDVISAKSQMPPFQTASTSAESKPCESADASAANSQTPSSVSFGLWAFWLGVASLA